MRAPSAHVESIAREVTQASNTLGGGRHRPALTGVEPLLVTQSLDRVLSRGAHRGVERAERAAEEPYEERDDEPARLYVNRERRRVHDEEARGERQHQPQKHAEHAHDQSLLLDDPRHARVRHPQRFEHAYLPRALGDGRVHREEYDEHAYGGRDAHDHVYENVERGHARRVQLGQVAREENLAFGEGRVYALGDGVLLGGVVDRDEYPRAE